MCIHSRVNKSGAEETWDLYIKSIITLLSVSPFSIFCVKEIMVSLAFKGKKAELS